MKQFIIPLFASFALLSVVACNGSNGGSTPAPIPQIVSNGTYTGTVPVPDATTPTSIAMVVSGLSATITVTNTQGSDSITGTFNANVATSSSGVNNSTCYNGLLAETPITMTNCLYVAATNTFSANLVYSQTPIPIKLVATS